MKKTCLALVLPLIFGCASHVPLLVGVEMGAWYFSVQNSPVLVAIKADDMSLTKSKNDENNLAALITSTNENDGWAFSIFIEPAKSCSTTPSCRDFSLNGQSKYGRNLEIRKWEDEAGAYYEYLIDTAMGIPIRQKNRSLNFVKDGFWYDLHLSKLNFKPEDDSIFDGIFARTTVVKKSSISEGKDDDFRALELIRDGTSFYANHDYKNAIGPYEQAMELEKSGARLSKTMWRVLVDNLGMAYGLTGNLGKAKEVFEYGLSKDPTYANFLYSLACTYAEMDNKENAMSFLKQAFINKGNTIEGERLPDPARDSSFRKYANDTQFKKLLSEIKKY